MNTQQIPSFLTVTNRQVKTDKKGKEYAHITVSGDEKVSFVLPNGSVITATQQAKSSAFNAWKENYLPNPTEDFGWRFKVGEVVLGSIVTRPVVPYEFTDKNTSEVRVANTYTCVVLGDTTKPDYEIAIAREFKQNNRQLLNQVSTPVVVAEEATSSVMGA